MASAASSRLLAALGAGWLGSAVYSNSAAALEFAGAVGAAAAAFGRAVLGAAPAVPPAGAPRGAGGGSHGAMLVDTGEAVLLALPLAGGAGVAWLLVSGFGLDNVAWVTRATFRRWASALKDGVGTLEARVARLREEVAARLTALQEGVDAGREEHAELLGRVVGVDAGVRTVQADVADLRALADAIKTELADVAVKQALANRGIHYLCTVVKDTVVPAMGHPLPDAPIVNAVAQPTAAAVPTGAGARAGDRVQAEGLKMLLTSLDASASDASVREQLDALARATAGTAAA